jgi:hypothetical protein
MFSSAQREQKKLRMLISGISGCGKTKQGLIPVMHTGDALFGDCSHVELRIMQVTGQTLGCAC